MFFFGLFLVILFSILIITVFQWLGNRTYTINQKQQELDDYAYKQHEKHLLKELEHQQAQLDIANNMINLQKTKNKLEDDYINKLLKEKTRIEKELHELQSNNYPTREQLDNWLFTMQAQNRLTNLEANRIMKIYDIKGIYPTGKLPTRKD